MITILRVVGLIILFGVGVLAGILSDIFNVFPFGEDNDD